MVCSGFMLSGLFFLLLVSFSIAALTFFPTELLWYCNRILEHLIKGVARVGRLASAGGAKDVCPTTAKPTCLKKS